ncbi:hypothetical protein BCON_0011g00080 [Botryotinia convoluta]|uniref:Uncharacterized protein n=1 Tax=Botryotinia convoluta TaxID=54673 RepID=A0A4Z1IW96_9HELO|nr:hypothetical protein BCON_0011g00080 [Botryotinia convoluta]
MHSPNSPSNQFHLNNSLFKFTNILLDFSRPLHPPPSPSRAPPPLSYLAGHNIPVSVPELSEEIVFRASLDGNLDDIHYPAETIPDPRLSTESPQISHHIISSPSTTFLSHQPQITMPSPQFSRSATSPDLLTPSTISPIPELQEYTPNRDGAISHADRYSRVLPAMPPHPSTPPPPIPTIPSSSSSNIFNSARPSGLRHVTFAHETDSLSLTSSHPSQTSSSIPTSTTSPPRKHRFNLTLAHQKMHKAFSTLRTHTLSPKPSLLLRKKSSHSALFASSSGSSLLSASEVSADEPTRPKNAPSSSSSSGFTSFPAMPGSFPKDAKNAKAGKEMQISAPMGMVKKTPEEIQQMLREMGVKSEDLPFVSSSASGSAPTPTSSHSHFNGDGDDSGNTPSKSGIPKILTSNSREEEKSPVLSAVQKGKRIDLGPITESQPIFPPKSPHFTLPTRSSSLSTPHSPPSLPFPVQDLTTKPIGWYSTAPLDEIRATLPKIKNEDLFKNEEIDGFLEELVRDFEVIRKVREWRGEKLDEEIEELRRECAEREDGDGDGYDMEEDIEDEEEEPYIWGRYGEPDPRFVDGGWAQEEISSAGVGKRWFVFDDVENVLGGPKCPITHAVDGFEDAGDICEVTGGDREVVGYDGEVEREEINTTLLSPIEEGFGEGEEEEGEEEFDEDARQLSQEEILRREGLL